MIVGVPKEIKSGETRVALTPAGARALQHDGHRVLIEAGAGAASGIPDEQFLEAGASVVPVEDLFRESGLIIKVKEPQDSEYARFRRDQILFTYLHLAPLPGLTQALLDAGAAAVAYETIEDAGLRSGVNILKGRIVCRAVADSQGKKCDDVEELI